MIKSPLIRKLFSCFIALIGFSSILLFLTSCTNEPPAQQKTLYDLSAEEQQWLTKFFNDIMLEHSAIYTLWGSKPVTEIVIEHHSEKEMKAYFDSLSEEEKKNRWIVNDYDLAENWEKWKQIRQLFPIKRYLFFQSEWRRSPDATFVYFVDILKTAITIEENYSLFRKQVGFDFDPTRVVFEMTTNDSIFWKKIDGNSLLWGILFGYGKENAYAFHWKYYEHAANADTFFNSIKHEFSESVPFGELKIGLDNFEIPSFVSFNDNDETIQKYQIEREKIRNQYKNEQFLDLTLKRLTRE